MYTLTEKAEIFKTKYESFITGCDAIEELNLWDKDKYGEMEAFYTNDIASIIIRIIASDGVISNKEVLFFNEAFGFNYTLSELNYVYETCSDNIQESFDENFENGLFLLKKINEKLYVAYKEILYLICDIIIDSDEIVTFEEQREIEKLREMCG